MRSVRIVESIVISLWHIVSIMTLSDETKVSLVTAGCILSLAIVSKNILRAQLDFISLYGPVWVFIAYIITKDKVKSSKICCNPLFWVVAIIVVTASILVLYAI